MLSDMKKNKIGTCEYACKCMPVLIKLESSIISLGVIGCYYCLVNTLTDTSIIYSDCIM